MQHRSCVDTKKDLTVQQRGKLVELRYRGKMELHWLLSYFDKRLEKTAVYVSFISFVQMIKTARTQIFEIRIQLIEHSPKMVVQLCWQDVLLSGSLLRVRVEVSYDSSQALSDGSKLYP